MQFDLSHLPLATRQKIDEIFRKDFNLDVLKAVERQTRMAKRNENGQRWRGEMCPQYEIDPVVDTLWRKVYGHNYTENKDLMRFLVRRNPEIFVKARSGKIQTGYTRAQAERRGCRFAPGTMTFAK